MHLQHLWKIHFSSHQQRYVFETYLDAAHESKCIHTLCNLSFLFMFVIGVIFDGIVQFL